MASTPPPAPGENPSPKRSGVSIGVFAVIVVCACGCLMAPILGAIILPVLLQARQTARNHSSADSACLSNVKQIAVGQLMYAADWDDRFPPAPSWTAPLAPYLKSMAVFGCPNVRGSHDYGMDKRLSKMDQSKIADPARTFLIFESNAGSMSPVGIANKDQAMPPRHANHKENSFGFADGHARLFPADVIARMK